MNLTADELGENYKTLDMVCSFDLIYDDAGMLVDAKDEHRMRMHLWIMRQQSPSSVRSQRPEKKCPKKNGILLHN